MRPSSGLSCSPKWKCTAHPTLTSSTCTSLPSTGTTSPNSLRSPLHFMMTRPRPKTNPPRRDPRPLVLLGKWGMLMPTLLLAAKREIGRSRSPTFLRLLPLLPCRRKEGEAGKPAAFSLPGISSPLFVWR
jgi:hypothetical protein